MNTNQSARFHNTLPTWLHEHGISLALSTYRANRLIFIGTRHTGHLRIHERLFDRPMGLFSEGNHLWMAGRSHIWRFDNLLSEGQEHEGCDRLYVPAASFLTGEVNAHEVVVDAEQQPIFVNTAFSCLAKLAPGCSFQPIWQPPFIDRLVPEDRCHLNGVCLLNGEPNWVTACSSKNDPSSWRRHRVGSGAVIHIPSGRIEAQELTMPHSPRWHQGKLWLLNSGTGELGCVENNQFKPICQLDGFARGLAFYGNCAVVGLSKLRSAVFTGLPIEERLQQSGGSPLGSCGLRVINLNSGEILHSLDLPEPIDELFDLLVLKKAREPLAFGIKDDSIDRLVKLPQYSSLISISPSTPSGNPHEGATVSPVGFPDDRQVEISSMKDIRYQKVYQITPSTLAPYAALTFPSLAPGSPASSKVKGELLGLSAMHQGQMVGLALAECTSETSAKVISLMVSAAYRSRGIGTRLMSYLRDFLKQDGIHQLSISYKVPFHSRHIIERLLDRLGWQSPQQTFLLLHGHANQLAQINWPERFPLPSGYTIEPWRPEFGEEAVLAKAPADMQALVNSARIEAAESFALLHKRALVGWIIADHSDGRSVRYRSLYLAPKHRIRGQGLHLLTEALRRQHQKGIPIARAVVAKSNTNMLRLVERHLQQHLHGLTVFSHRVIP